LQGEVKEGLNGLRYRDVARLEATQIFVRDYARVTALKWVGLGSRKPRESPENSLLVRVGSQGRCDSLGSGSVALTTMFTF